VNYYEPPKTPIFKAAGPTPASASINRWIVLLLAAVAALAPAFLAIPYTEAFRAAIYLGHWPYYGHPDPKDLPDDFQPPEVLEVIIPGVVFVVSTTLIQMVVGYVGLPRRRLMYSLSILGTLWFSSFVILLADPFGVMEWIMD
jgi:hypothetical protein